MMHNKITKIMQNKMKMDKIKIKVNSKYLFP